MDESIAGLAVASTVFVGSHFLMSHPLRKTIISMIGEKLFPVFYSLVAIGTMAWMIYAYSKAPYYPLWPMLTDYIVVMKIVMVVSMIFVFGGLMRNPAMHSDKDTLKSQSLGQGIYATTRHPLLWGLALWAISHGLFRGDAAMLILCIAILALALIGAHMQDLKKEKLLGADWKHYESLTSYWPLKVQITGKRSWKSIWPGFAPIMGGIGLFLIIQALHSKYIGGAPALFALG